MSDVVSAVLAANSANSSKQALNAVIQHAPSLGIDNAIQQFGGSLSDTEKAVLKGLSPGELSALSSANSKLSGLLAGAADNNNNL